MGLVTVRRFSISMVYSKALSCGGTVKPFEREKLFKRRKCSVVDYFTFDSKRTLSMVERILKLGWWIDKTTVRLREVQMDLRVLHYVESGGAVEAGGGFVKK
ncbi:hypothetical protein M0R45_038137 [Rubus argutus]|uniref:Uncharacterized protein n=1 Tax=Rubus argutus TaxID=59490 RepID=A0AAW1W1H4_RUBAR